LLSDKKGKYPICPPNLRPPLSYLEFISDAAGFACLKNSSQNVGAGSVGFDQNGEFIFAKQIFWPKELKNSKLDEKGCDFGNKTTFLKIFRNDPSSDLYS